jgi:hypothetical protein
MTLAPASQRFLRAALRGSTKRVQQQRSHHPDPFNPKQTRGWKAALMVRNFSIECDDIQQMSVFFFVLMSMFVLNLFS